MQARDKKCESNEEESEEECPETKSKFRIWEGIRNARARKKGKPNTVKSMADAMQVP